MVVVLPAKMIVAYYAEHMSGPERTVFIHAWPCALARSRLIAIDDIFTSLCLLESS